MPGSSSITAFYSLKRRAAFTLVEMLAVMGVISLLLLVTLPALRGINQSQSRRGAVGNLMAVLDQARMMAISGGCSTYVVFACHTSSTPQLSPSLWGRAYAIFQDSDNVNFKPVQRTPWLYLPTGMAFKKDDNIPCITNRMLGGSDPVFPVGNTFLSDSAGAAGVQLPYWKFDSTGAVDTQTPESLRVLLFPGFIDANTGAEVPTENAHGKGNVTAAQFEEIDVNPATGRAKYIPDPANNLSTPSSTSTPSP